MENTTLISIEALRKHFPTSGGSFTALNGIDLKIGKSEFTGVVGPSGSGKTTLLNIIGSLDSPSEGKAVVLGQSISDLNPKQAALLRRSKLGFIFQSYNLLPVYTVFENVEFPLLLLKFDDNQRRKMVMDSLEWLGLTDKLKSKPAQLSGGECQRVAIARAMVKKPEIVLADEPTANLDAANSHNILKTMVQLNKEFGTTFIFATHDDKVIGYLKRKISLVDGKVTTDEIMNNLILVNMNLLFRLAVKNLIGAGLRTWLNVIVLSFSFLIIIWHKGLLDGWDRQAKNETIKWEIGGGQYWYSSYDPYDPFSLTEAHARIPSSLDSLISAGSIAPILITQGTVYPRGRIQSILIKGISSNQKLLKIPSSLLIKNSEDIPAIIGKNTATDNGIKEGDLITLRWRDVHGTFDANNIKIIGIFNTDVPTVDMGQIWVPLDRLQKMMDMAGEATIIVSDKERLDKFLSGEWKFKDDEILLKSITDLIKMKSVGGYVMYIILLSLAMLAIFDTQVLSIFRRQKEIGTYIALGMTRRQVVGLFTIEGSLNSVLAGLLAALYGIPLLALQTIHGMSIPGGSKGFGLAVADKIYPVYSLGLVITTILLILLTTTIVSYMPSRKIARMKPTEALRGKIQ